VSESQQRNGESQFGSIRFDKLDSQAKCDREVIFYRVLPQNWGLIGHQGAFKQMRLEMVVRSADLFAYTNYWKESWLIS